MRKRIIITRKHINQANREIAASFSAGVLSRHCAMHVRLREFINGTFYVCRTYAKDKSENLLATFAPLPDELYHMKPPFRRSYSFSVVILPKGV